MNQAYLFVHFKEKTTPDGEPVNGGNPVLWAYYGDKGVRDHTIVRANGRFYIFATDLSLAYGMRCQYHNSWEEISRGGSKCLSCWESEDLLHWSEQQLVRLGDDDFGCLWAPDVFFDEKAGDYVLHWSSSHRANGYGPKGIFYSRTRDFQTFSPPELLYRREKSGVIDSAIYMEDGLYYMFLKSEHDPARIRLLTAEDLAGPYTPVLAFDREMEKLEAGVYEAPTAVRLEDGRWCLFLDYYGVPGAGQGYVPFIAPSLKSGAFVRSDRDFRFPYGFKHGTILAITPEEYQRLKNFEWPQN